MDAAQQLRKEKISTIREAAGVEAYEARCLLVACDWDLEKALEQLPPPPPPLRPSEETDNQDVQGAAVGDDVWAFFAEEWHRATVRKLQPDGLIQVLWSDGTATAMPKGLIAIRGDRAHI